MALDDESEVVIIEARDRIGGRVYTVPLGDGSVMVDSGATWLQQLPK